MQSKHLKKRNSYFKALKGLSKKEKQEYLNECSNTMIHVICEACFNLLKHEKLKNKKDINRRVKPIEKEFRTLSDENIPVEEKREVLNKIGVEAISLIVKHILPLLTALVEK